jgi:hypothetical protein
MLDVAPSAGPCSSPMCWSWIACAQTCPSGGVACRRRRRGCRGLHDPFGPVDVGSVESTFRDERQTVLVCIDHERYDGHHFSRALLEHHVLMEGSTTRSWSACSHVPITDVPVQGTRQPALDIPQRAGRHAPHRGPYRAPDIRVEDGRPITDSGRVTSYLSDRRTHPTSPDTGR